MRLKKIREIEKNKSQNGLEVPVRQRIVGVETEKIKEYLSCGE